MDKKVLYNISHSKTIVYDNNMVEHALNNITSNRHLRHF